MLNKQTERTTSIQAEKKITVDRLKAKRKNRSFDWFDLRFETRIMLVDFSYHPQIHDWVWIYFYLKELTKVDFFLDFFFFFKYC